MKIFIVTGARSEFDIISPIIEPLKKKHNVGLIVCGTHLSNWYGESFSIIKNSNVKVFAKIKSDFDGDNKSKRLRSIHTLINGITKCVEKEKPDLLIYAGDREEGVAASIVCNYMNILFAHIAGGDPVWGNADDPARFAISKLAHMHLVFTKRYKQNLLKVGEEKFRICNSGNPSLDTIRKTKDLNLKQLSKNLAKKIPKDYIVLIKHPLSSEENKVDQQIKKTLTALEKFCIKNDFKTIIIYPNTDPGSKKIIKNIKIYKKKNSFIVFKNLPRLEFVNLIRKAKALIGNSSMGILEAPFYKLPVVNIGNRQRGRLNAGNVVFTNYLEKNILKALNNACFNVEYRKKVKKISNIYGKGYSASKITNFIEKINLKSKKWYIKKKLC